MEKRLRQKVEQALAGILGPAEQLLVGTNGMHPKLAVGIGTMASILIGALAGSAIQTATDWGADLNRTVRGRDAGPGGALVLYIPKQL